MSSRRSAVVRSLGVVPERGPALAPGASGRHVALEALGRALAEVEWAPLRLAAGTRARPASPRLPQALVLHLAADARRHAPVGASIASVALRPDVPGLAPRLGTDAEQVGRTLDALRAAGVLCGAGDTRHLVCPAAPGAAEDAVYLAGLLLGPAPRCATLDWDFVALATTGAPTAWVAAHVLAERLAPDEWTPVSRGALEDALACGTSGLRNALDRLAASEVIERREQRGGVSAYRFTPPALGHAGQGRGGEPVQPRGAFAGVGGHAAAGSDSGSAWVGRGVPLAGPSLPGTPASPAIATAPEAGVRLVLGGVELEVPAGMRAVVEVGPDGRPRVTLAIQPQPPS